MVRAPASYPTISVRPREGRAFVLGHSVSKIGDGYVRGHAQVFRHPGQCSVPTLSSLEALLSERGRKVTLRRHRTHVSYLKLVHRLHAHVTGIGGAVH